MTKHMHQPIATSEDKYGKRMVCKTCKEKISFNKDSKGRVDNRKYLEFNKRNFVQPFGRTGNLYRSIYGNPDPHKFEYKPRHIARAEAEKGWKELSTVHLKDKKTYL